MGNHCVFYGKTAAAGSQHLIIRSTVLSRIQDTAVLYGILHSLHIPVCCLQSAVSDCVHRTDRIHYVPGSAGDQIDLICRLLKHDDILRQPVRGFISLRDDQDLLTLRQREQEKVSLTAVDGEAAGVFRLKSLLKHQAFRNRTFLRNKEGSIIGSRL